MKTVKSIGENIRIYRQKLNLTQEQLGNIIGVSSQAVSKWECGESLPDTALLVSIANTLNISADRLLGNEKICENDILCSIIQMIADEDEENKFKKAFEITWMIENGLGAKVFGFEFDTAPSVPCMGLSEIIMDSGFSYISLFNKIPFFTLFPEPENGFAPVLESDERYREFFAAFSDFDVMNAFFYLHSQPCGYLFEKEVLAAKCAIGEDKIDIVMEYLSRYFVKGTIVNINNEERCLYQYRQKKEFIMIFAILKTLFNCADKEYRLQINRRKKPYFA